MTTLENKNSPQTIVAEISKHWPSPSDKILSQRFESVIEVNRNRGYKLKDWRFSQVLVPSKNIDGQDANCLVETIIAVFEKS